MNINKKKLKGLLNNIITFDIETELFSKEFSDSQEKGEDIFDFVPLPRVCVCYDSFSNKYETYLPEDFKKLYDKLIDRNILSFNGLNFDIKVILKYLGKKKNDPLMKKKNHYDLLDLIRKETGKRYSLDDLVRSNFKERKHTLGREMENMDIEKLTEACHSDVEQTYRLMKIFLDDKIVCKYYRVKREEQEDYEESGVIYCSDPRIAMEIIKLNEETPEERNTHYLQHQNMLDNMTDGQCADYMAGFREDYD